jgi:Concanavalin A-like lectin/glucanases superfamily
VVREARCGNCGSVDNNFFLPVGTPRMGWVHFSFSYDGQANQFHFTINGSEMISNANRGITHPIGMWPAEQGWNSTKSPLRIGTTDEFVGPPGWQGKIDELRVWNVYRTADQIKTNMKVILKGNEPGLAAYYKFDEGSGMSSADATGDTSNAANFVGADKATAPMWVKSDIPGPFTCAP